jgi:hypothetical protein
MAGAFWIDFGSTVFKVGMEDMPPGQTSVNRALSLRLRCRSGDAAQSTAGVDVRRRNRVALAVSRQLAPAVPIPLHHQAQSSAVGASVLTPGDLGVAWATD